MSYISPTTQCKPVQQRLPRWHPLLGVTAACSDCPMDNADEIVEPDDFLRPFLSPAILINLGDMGGMVLQNLKIR